MRFRSTLPLLLLAVWSFGASAGSQNSDAPNPSRMDKKQLEASAKALQVDTRTLQKTMADQRSTLEGLTFKAIPTQQVELAYRDHL